MMRYAVKSDRGRVRQINEDSYNIIAGYSEIPSSFIIADGMGGHNSGDVASKMAVDIVSKYILQLTQNISEEYEINSILQNIIKKTNLEIYNTSKENEAYFGMGTTLIIAIVFNKKIIIGHVGDSRAYVLRNNEMVQLTIDHSFIEELIKNGSITREEAENHPKKNVITRALGCSEDIAVDMYSINIMENDIFILCTDGLTNMLELTEIIDIINIAQGSETACNRLVSSAIEKGGEDNITVIMFSEDSL